MQPNKLFFWLDFRRVSYIFFSPDVRIRFVYDIHTVFAQIKSQILLIVNVARGVRGIIMKTNQYRHCFFICRTLLESTNPFDAWKYCFWNVFKRGNGYHARAYVNFVGVVSIFSASTFGHVGLVVCEISKFHVFFMILYWKCDHFGFLL